MEFEIIVSLVTLTFMEVVLGIDNILFISILSSKLPRKEAWRARIVGVTMAVMARVILLLCITWIIGLEAALFSIGDHSVSGRDLILMAGGLFLIGKSTMEIHDKLEGEREERLAAPARQFVSIIFQIVLIDIVFSFDSILTAIGLADLLWIMVTAIVISLAIMVPFMGLIGSFVERHPTVKVLGLSFLLLIGFMLLLDGFNFEIPKGYIYFALFFSMFVEFLNMRLRKKASVTGT